MRLVSAIPKWYSESLMPTRSCNAVPASHGIYCKRQNDDRRRLCLAKVRLGNVVRHSRPFPYLFLGPRRQLHNVTHSPPYAGGSLFLGVLTGESARHTTNTTSSIVSSTQLALTMFCLWYPESRLGQGSGMYIIGLKLSPELGTRRCLGR